MTGHLLDRILADAERLPFVVLVTRLARALGSATPIGEGGPYSTEPIRFRHDSALSFHPGDIRQAKVFEEAGETSWVELTTTFAGLTGAASPLPPSFVERFCREEDDELSVHRDFLDLFHHRLLSLFYRGLLKSDVPRSTKSDGSSRVLDWVLLLAGLDPAHIERLSGLSRGQLLSLAPLLVTYPPNAERLRVALRHLLADLLGTAEVSVQEMRGGFVVLDPSARARLGVDLRLGRTSTLGRRAPAPAGAIGIQIGPLPPDVCARLRPGGDRFDELNAIACLFCPETVDVAVELPPTHTPPSRLGRPRLKLGRDSWLSSRGKPAPLRFTLQPRSTRKNAYAS